MKALGYVLVLVLAEAASAQVSLNFGPYIGEPLINNSIDATQRAVAAANQDPQARLAARPFTANSRATFDGKHWNWRGMVPYGNGDLEATVSMRVDGSIEKLEILHLVSMMNSAF